MITIILKNDEKEKEIICEYLDVSWAYLVIKHGGRTTGYINREEDRKQDLFEYDGVVYTGCTIEKDNGDPEWMERDEV